MTADSGRVDLDAVARHRHLYYPERVVLRPYWPLFNLINRAGRLGTVGYTGAHRSLEAAS